MRASCRAPAGWGLTDAGAEQHFQQAQDKHRAGRLGDAVNLYRDTLARDPRFDAVNRWQSEWNLARALQVHGQTREAYDRVTRLLAGATEAAGLPAELRARMAWLQARLAAEAGKPEETLALVDALAGGLDGVTAELRGEIASSAELLRAKANFALNRDAEALGTAIARLLADRELAERMGSAGLARAPRFSIDATVDGTLAVYERVIASGSAGR